MKTTGWCPPSWMESLIYTTASHLLLSVSAELTEQLARIYGHLKGSVEDDGLTVHHIPVQNRKESLIVAHLP